MRVGLVCPYSYDVPGGVQYHVRDLAEHLRAHGHEAEVLAPAEEGTALPPHTTSCGRAVPVRYNGSVARLTFGPVTAARVRRWVEAGGFDVLHVHEPVTPSASVLALWAATGPVVATFHTSTLRSRAMTAAAPVLRGSLEKVLGRIAVSPEARRTVAAHLGGDAVVIPNGVRTGDFTAAVPDPTRQGTAHRPTVAFLGRAAEPRKGLVVLLRAMAAVLTAHPGTRLLLAGPEATAATVASMTADPRVRAACEPLGEVDDATKAALLAAADVYVAPQVGGESFGIVLVEAMAAGAAVLASDLPAFVDVLDAGACGTLFPTGDADACARALTALLADPRRRAEHVAAGRERARRFDWDVVGGDIVAVYETVLAAGAPT